jgi:hypothetical protein
MSAKSTVSEFLAGLIQSSEPLHEDLVPYIEDCSLLGKILRHPLVFSVPYHEQFNGFLNKQYEAKKESLQRYREDKNWIGYLFIHERPHRLDAFLEIMAELSHEDYWRLLGDLWSDSENIWQNYWAWQFLLGSCRPGQEFLMEERERQELARLPERVRVYRGHQDQNELGYSWTLSYHVARWFADRFGSQKGEVVTGLVFKEAIKALLLGRQEVEVVVSPDDVEDIEPFSSFPPREPALQDLFDRLWAQAPLNVGRRTAHGIEHWNKVDSNVVALASQVPGCNLKVARLFAAFHDSQRESESHDPEHGLRGALLAREWLASTDWLTPSELDQLTYACADHDQGKTSEDPTIGVCWDADRLDLTRVGVIPHADYLSTEAARKLICQV